MLQVSFGGTSLNWISDFIGVGLVDGVVEADEVFFFYSYKATKSSNITRPSRKIGNKLRRGGLVMNKCVLQLILIGNVI